MDSSRGRIKVMKFIFTWNEGIMKDSNKLYAYLTEVRVLKKMWQ